ncbi:hypothetical protein V5E97_05400 [Singulisphaera sp. Ch08]|uniref:Uncharacterized protein n=1 Tax=Singulisphaera sp. Ch08 TaxID=3120278 RepID=A0AAU7CJN1_9BACT
MSEARIEERLERLEEANARARRECQRWRRGGLLALVGVTILAVGGAASKSWPTIEAKEFILRDPDGLARATLALRPDGTPGLALFDKQGQVRLSLDLDLNDAPGVNLYGQDGAMRAAVAIRPDGTPGIGLFDKLRRPRLSLDLGMDEAAGVNVFGDGGLLRAALAIRPDGTPGLGLFDRQGQVVQSFDLGPDAEPAQPQPEVK